MPRNNHSIKTSYYYHNKINTLDEINNKHHLLHSPFSYRTNSKHFRTIYTDFQQMMQEYFFFIYHWPYRLYLSSSHSFLEYSLVPSEMKAIFETRLAVCFPFVTILFKCRHLGGREGVILSRNSIQQLKQTASTLCSHNITYPS